MYYILYNRVRFRYNKGSGTFPTKASITGVVQIFWSHTALDSSNVRMSRQGGKLKPLKAPKKDKKDDDEEDKAFKEKKKADEAAEKAAKERASKGGPLGAGLKKSSGKK
jgi:hypothetical protein